MSSVLYDAPGPRARRRELLIFSRCRRRPACRLCSSCTASSTAGTVGGRALAGIHRTAAWSERAEDVWRSLLVTGLLAHTAGGGGRRRDRRRRSGSVLAIGRMATAAVDHGYPVIVVIEFFRGLPVVLLMFFGVIALGLPLFWGVVFGLVLYNGAIIAEILRAGIVSLPKGQTEAAYAIGLTRTQTLFTILLPQAVRRMLPSLVSQLVVLNKDTSLGFIIGYAELLRRLQLNTQFFGQRYWFQFFVVGTVIYIAVNFTLSRLAVWLERRGIGEGGWGYSACRGRRGPGRRADRDRRRPVRLRLLGELGGSRLAHHGDPDLAWVGQLLLDLLGDVAGENRRRRGRRRRREAP